jgi:hypothetical protein
LRIGRLVLVLAALAAVLAVVLVMSWRDFASPDSPAVSKSGETPSPARTKPSQLSSTPSPAANVQTIPFPPASSQPAARETLEQAVAAYRQSNPVPMPAPSPPRLGPNGQPLTLKEALDVAQEAARARAVASAAASPFSQDRR